MRRDELLKKITILDFMALDLALYLNTHPKDDKAIQQYNEVIKNADKHRCIYEKEFGPLCSYRSLGTNDWCWKNEPWPWCSDYNFVL